MTRRSGIGAADPKPLPGDGDGSRAPSGSCPVSVVVIVKNDRGVAATLAGLEEQTRRAGAELIVVDASEPHVLADIRAAHADVRWIAYPPSVTITIPHQRNAGLRAATGRAVAFVDANCEVGERWLPALLEALAGGEQIVCGPVIDRGAHLVSYFNHDAVDPYVEECSTQSVGFTRAVLASVGGFDESLPYGEDVDFFWLACDAGFRIRVCPELSVTHEPGDYREQFARAYRYGRSRAILYRRHWTRRRRYLFARELHVVAYPLYLLGLPLALVAPWYLALPLLPALRNRSWKVVVHHLVFGAGVLVGSAARLAPPDRPQSFREQSSREQILPQESDEEAGGQAGEQATAGT